MAFLRQPEKMINLAADREITVIGFTDLGGKEIHIGPPGLISKRLLLAAV